MSNTIPAFVLARANLSLYQADANGNAILSEPVWMGARAERIVLPREILEIENTRSGAAYDEYAQLSEQGEISIDRIWCLPKATLRDYTLRRGRFVMVLYDRDPVNRVWWRLIGYGVQARSYRIESVGVHYLISDQVWRVQRWDDKGGTLNELGEEVEAGVTKAEQALLFTHDNALAVGNYFIGCYQFAVGVRIGFTKAIARSGGSATVPGATTVALEINGAVSPYTLTLPGGAGAEVSAEAGASGTGPYGVEVAAGSRLRWVVVAAPPANGTELAGITMMVREV